MSKILIFFKPSNAHSMGFLHQAPHALLEHNHSKQHMYTHATVHSTSSRPAHI